MLIFSIICVLILITIGIYDVLQKKHTLWANVPVIGRTRQMFEGLGDKFRQYFFESNRDGLPFNRSERSWIYAVSKEGDNPEKGFGSDKDFSHPDHFFIKPALIPGRTILEGKDYAIKPKKIIGPHRKKPYHPTSIVNISGMSFGALSAKAVEAMNRGAKLANVHHTTGEGGLSPYHLISGANVVLQFGTGYFGARGPGGTFSFEKLKALVNANPQIVAIEFKISQGAKPLKQSKFPSSKITEEIRRIRELGPLEDAISPAYHTMFGTDEAMLDFLEKVADVSGLPVGIKCAVGKEESWENLCKAIVKKGICFDYLITDSGDGGTGSATESFTSYVGLPFLYSFSSMYKIFQKYELTDKITFIGSGKLGLSHKACLAFAMGCDMINVGREAMLSIGCLQTQHCHVGGSILNGGCPVGIATQNEWSQRGLDPYIKGKRCANYLIALRKEIIEMTNAAGYSHPSQFTTIDIMVNSGDSKGLLSLKDIYGYEKIIKLHEQTV